jgi:hypothetical protein
VFGFIKKGGEIRLGETLATHQQIMIKVPIPNPGKRREMIKLTRKTMNSIHLTHNNFIMPLMPMCMCW